LLQRKYAFSFNCGRSAFLAILHSLNLNKGDEVLLQGFSCSAAVNPIIWAGLKPVFIDIKKETLNIDYDILKTKISEKSRVVVVQHTFGMPAEMEEILKICKENNLILIEDCAHSLGAEYKGRKVGTFGRASFFSFGRDKVISSVHGGMAVTDDEKLGLRIKEFQKECGYPHTLWILRQLLHPILTNWLVLPTYDFLNLGKAILLCLQFFHILSKASSTPEKKGIKPSYIAKSMPNAQAALARNQFKKIKRFNQHRQEIATLFDKNLRKLRVLLPQALAGRIYLRYSLLFKNNKTMVCKILKKAKEKAIYLNDGWRQKPIVPPDTIQENMGYVEGSCPVAEDVARNILNLPCHINISLLKAKKIADFLKDNIKESS